MSFSPNIFSLKLSFFFKGETIDPSFLCLSETKKNKRVTNNCYFGEWVVE